MVSSEHLQGRESWKEGANGHLCDRLLHGSTTAEGTSANGSDDGEHKGEDDPADPCESHESLGRVAVREWVALVGAVERAAGAVSEGSGTSKPEDPGEEDRDTVSSNRGDDATNASKEETGLLRGEMRHNGPMKMQSVQVALVHKSRAAGE